MAIEIYKDSNIVEVATAAARHERIDSKVREDADKLIKEASRMGFKRAILPQRNLERASRSAAGMELTGVRTLAEALTASSQISQK